MQRWGQPIIPLSLFLISSIPPPPSTTLHWPRTWQWAPPPLGAPLPRAVAAAQSFLGPRHMLGSPSSPLAMAAYLGSSSCGAKLILPPWPPKVEDPQGPTLLGRGGANKWHHRHEKKNYHPKFSQYPFLPTSLPHGHGCGLVKSSREATPSSRAIAAATPSSGATTPSSRATVPPPSSCACCPFLPCSSPLPPMPPPLPPVTPPQTLPPAPAARSFLQSPPNPRVPGHPFLRGPPLPPAPPPLIPLQIRWSRSMRHRSVEGREWWSDLLDVATSSSLVTVDDGDLNTWNTGSKILTLDRHSTAQ
nr:unnamed protein product [Digitaria exilis]